MLQINSGPDHIHIFIGFRPHQSISALIQNEKTESSKWINKQKFCAHLFEWQDGYGAFSYAKSQVDDVIRYIQKQEIHHRKETFLDEDRKFLPVFEIEWDENTSSKNPNSTRRSEGTLIIIIIFSTRQLFPRKKT